MEMFLAFCREAGRQRASLDADAQQQQSQQTPEPDPRLASAAGPNT